MLVLDLMKQIQIFGLSHGKLPNGGHLRPMVPTSDDDSCCLLVLNWGILFTFYPQHNRREWVFLGEPG